MRTDFSNVLKSKSILKIHILIFLLLLLISSTSFAHSGKTRYHIIIDTDAALDDLRAICLFLASPEFEVLAITTSDGVVSSIEGWKKLNSLLKGFGHEGILTGAGRVIQKNIPPWRAFNREILWGEEEGIELKDGQSSVDTILSALELEEDPVHFICMGGLTNLAHALTKNSEVQEKIERIVWYSDGLDQLSGTNYDFDQHGAMTVLSTSIFLEAVSNDGIENPTLSPQFLESIRVLRSSYAEKIFTTHDYDEVKDRIKTGHLEFWDDLLPVYMLHPELFLAKMSENADHHKSIRVQDWEGVKAAYLEILTSRNQVESKVFDGFPDNPELYADDVRPLIQDIIQRHGKEEWRLGVLTNELHGHLGIYAIVGTKMGLRARQYFHVGIDNISLLSHAGNMPPLSCMNDGLQVSSGGTLGHGLITVFPDPPFQPKAVFSFKGRSVCISLKERFWQIIKNDIREGIRLYGLNTENYWKYVRELALQYWMEWDRLKIFDIDPSLRENS
jgi:inosine-uridine nucleoside N-ribohydrolase